MDSATLPDATGPAPFRGPVPLGRYELLLEMGYGGMATLYLARMSGPSSFEKQLAIKKIHDALVSDPQMVKMFMDEANISARIQHPNVVQIFEFDVIDGAHFIAMEYVHGHDFAALLAAVSQHGEASYRWTHAARIVAEAAAGLHAAHELVDIHGESLNLVHRDVSPQNLLIGYDGYVKVTDFGIAQARNKLSKTMTGTVKGKVAYMSPEQVHGGAVDRRTDVFALGIVLFEAVTLTRLFREPTDVGTMRRVAAADVPTPRSIRPDLPEALEQVILKALAKDPAQRYQSAAELKVALERLLAAARYPVDAGGVAALMTELFGAQRQQRELEIRDVTQKTVLDARPPSDDALAATRAEGVAPVSPPQPERVTAPDAPTLAQPKRVTAPDAPTLAQPARATPPDETMPVAPRRRRSSLPMVIAAVAVLVLLAVLAGLVLRTPGDGDRRSASAEGSTQPARPTGKTVQLTLFVTPKEALLSVDGAARADLRGGVKRVLRVPRGETPLKVRVDAPGYTAQESGVVPIKDQVITINLIREVRARHRVVADAPGPAPRTAPRRTVARRRGAPAPRRRRWVGREIKDPFARRPAPRRPPATRPRRSRGSFAADDI